MQSRARSPEQLAKKDFAWPADGKHPCRRRDGKTAGRRDVDQVDVAIIGGGVIGCAVARALSEREPALAIAVIEKESQLAMHQSGRNSGVVHAGYNQKPGTLKARLVVEGSRRLREYCAARNITCNEDGIVIAARTEDETATLEELHKRGTANGATTKLLSRAELLELEPHAGGISALHAPQGASLDARSFVLSLADHARSNGVRIQPDEKAKSIERTDSGVTIFTAARSSNGSASDDRGTVRARVLLNAAGLQADRIAHQFGVGLDYRIVPFRGDYYELIDSRRDLVRSHLYPAPDLAFPFLGVHFSRTFDNRVIVGPGARLALGRESYNEWTVNPAQIAKNLGDLANMASFPGFWTMLTSKDMRRLAREEWKKALFKEAVAREGTLLLPQLRNSDLKKASCGIRAQLVNQKGALIDDLVVEETENSVHVLNAVSPALTCSLPFADQVMEMVLQKL